jgi:hypothetical protein
MKKQLLLVLGMLFASQANSIVNSVTDAQKELQTFRELVKEGITLRKKQDSFIKQWKNSIENCLLYSIANNSADKSLATAAENTWKISNLILNLYITVEAEQNKIKGDASIKKQVIALIQEKKVFLKQASNSINKIYLSPSKRTAKKVILDVIEALNFALNDLNRTITFLN